MSRKFKALIGLVVSLVVVGVFFAGYAATGGRGNIPADFEVTLSRGPCFGFCPVYDLIIQANGNVEFLPGFNREELEKPADSISPESVSKLYFEIVRMDFFKLQDRYSNDMITDLPSTEITVRVNGKQKSIYLYGLDEDIPEPLENLAEMIDELAGMPQK